MDRRGAVAGFDALYGALQTEVDALLLENHAQALGHVLVEGRQYLLAVFHHRHRAAQRGEDAGKLHADDAAADDAQTPGHLLQVEHLRGGDDLRQVGAGDGQAAGLRTGGDDDVRRCQHVVAHAYGVVGRQHGVSGIALHAGAFQHGVDACRQALHHLVFALYGGGQREGGLAATDAEGGGCFDALQHFRTVGQAFGGYAAFVQAGAAGGTFFDECDVLACGGGFEGRLISAGSGTDDDEVKLCHAYRWYRFRFVL